MTDKELDLLRETIEVSLASGTPWLPDKHHRDKQKCLRILKMEIRNRADQRKKENAQTL